MYRHNFFQQKEKKEHGDVVSLHVKKSTLHLSLHPICTECMWKGSHDPACLGLLHATAVGAQYQSDLFLKLPLVQSSLPAGVK